MHRALVVTTVLLVVWTRLANASDRWPGWRGPTGMGVTDEKRLPLAWDGKTRENVRWLAPLPGSGGGARPDHNQSSPVVWRDRVLVTTAIWPNGVAQKEFPEHHVTCYRAGDGKQLWDTQVPHGPWRLTDFRGGGYAAPTPATDGKRVYVLFGSAVLAALDPDGRLVWRKEVVPYAFDVTIGTSPVLYHDTLLVLCDQTDPKLSRLLAFDKETGNVRWERKRPNSGFTHTTPVLIDVKGKPQLLVSGSGTLESMDPKDGRLLWWCKCKGDAPSPIYGAGLVYCDDGRGGPGIAVDPTGEGDVTASHVKWTVGKIPGDSLSSAVIVGEYVYRLHQPGVLTCWKAADGAVVYNERLPGVSTTPSPIATPDGRIYFASGGKGAVIRAGPRFELLATNDLGDGDAYPASPAVAGGAIFIKGKRNLYCIGGR
jgi:outer membrane protein assembly factor BamB